MKNLFAIILLCITTLGFAQINEGHVVYEMKMEGLPPEVAAKMGEMTMSVYFKNKKSLAEVNMAMMKMNMKSLNDGTETLVLMESMGQKKYYKKTNKPETGKEKKAPKIEYTEEKKTVAGYECKKAIVHVETENGQTEPIEVWYSEKLYTPSLDSDEKSQFKGLKGMPLEYDMVKNGMRMKIVAKEVSVKPIADSKFVLSTEGYTKMTTAEAAKFEE